MSKITDKKKLAILMKYPEAGGNFESAMRIIEMKKEVRNETLNKVMEIIDELEKIVKKDRPYGVEQDVLWTLKLKLKGMK